MTVPLPIQRPAPDYVRERGHPAPFLGSCQIRCSGCGDTETLTAGPGSGHHPPEGACIFCGRPAHRYALTVQRAESWQRIVEPVCARCHALLTKAGPDGRKLKAKDETWFLGHGIGVYEAPGQGR